MTCPQILSRSDQASVRRGPRVFDPEERSNARSLTRTMSPPRAVSAPSGELCDARLTRAPQEISESRGSPFFGYFLWRSKESDLPSGNPRRGGHWPRAAIERTGGETNYFLISYVPQQLSCPRRRASRPNRAKPLSHRRHRHRGALGLGSRLRGNDNIFLL